MLVLSTLTTAQTTPTLIKDINTDGFFDKGSLAKINGNYFLPVKGNKVVFFANTDGDPYEEQPYVTDGTTAGTTLLNSTLYTALTKSHAHDPKNGLVYFSARKDVQVSSKADTELWVTDGTTTGTKKVKDIEPGDESSEPKDLTVANGLVYFTCDYGSFVKRGLWVSNGTDAGTIQLSDKIPNKIINFKGKIYLSMKVSSWDNELWESDGTVAGTKKLWIPLGASLNGILATKNFFYVQEGTKFSIFDIATKKATPLVDTYTNGPLNYDGPVSVGSKDFFATGKNFLTSSTSKNMLYTTDGTAAGTKQIKEFPDDLQQSYLYGAEKFVAFSAPDAAGLKQLWLSDGTAAGTTMVELNKGAESDPNSFCRVGNRLYFAAKYKDAAGKNYGRALMITDGTAAGTKLAYNLNSNGDDAKVTAISYVPLNNKPTLFFYAAPNSSIGQEPHKVEVSLISPIFEAENANFPADVYPNPSNGLLHIQAEDLASMDVYDLQGKVVLTKKHCSNSEQIELPKGQCH